jgi:MFS transporter, FHS family, L-fucose permease
VVRVLIKNPARQMDSGYLDRTPLFQFVLLSLLFPMWGAAAGLNDILITQFKHVFTLSDAATAFVQSAFYGGYFLLAIPASRIVRPRSATNCSRTPCSRTSTSLSSWSACSCCS